LKTISPRGLAGSNPAPSATIMLGELVFYGLISIINKTDQIENLVIVPKLCPFLPPRNRFLLIELMQLYEGR